MLSLTNLALRRGTNLLIDDTSLTIHRGYKVGLIGANGTGKTSLFELILGNLDADRGSIDLPASTRIAHMAQEVHGSNELAIDHVLGGDAEYADTIQRLQFAEDNEEYSDVANLHERLDNLDGYTARSRGEQLMAGLGFPTGDIEKPLQQFSGGWRIRLNLARTLMSPADLLLLDEPTNHLDMDAIIWLSQWIKTFTGTLVLISHDREFLDECVNHIAYLHQQRVELFTGNYSGFEIIKAARLAEQQSNFEKQQREVAHMQDFVRRFRAQATKARQAQSRIKSLQRMELIAPAHIDSPFSFEITANSKVSSPLLTLVDANLGYDEQVLGDVNVSILPGDRIGLLGINGAGKSTLIKTLRGELPLLAGSRTAGANLKVAYFSQHQLDELQLEQTAIDHLIELGRKLGDIPREQVVRNFLGGFNFHADKVLDPVRNFSGGEKARLALALITYTQPNLLLMDEPTNHLDIDMRQALTVALQTFMGALILVSHDRHLLANSVDQFLLIENGSIVRYAGDLGDYRNRILPTGEKLKAANPASKRTKTKPQKPGKVIRQLRTRINTLDGKIERLHRKLNDIEQRLADPEIYQTNDHPQLQNFLRDQLELKNQLEPLEEEWLTLSEALE